MHCPYCQQSVAEPSRCAVGGLDLARLDGLPGILPMRQAGLTDSAGVLPAQAARQEGAALRSFQERFPRIQWALLVEEAPDKVPMRTRVWWLFNRSRFSFALDKGFGNRDIQLGVDPVRRQAVVTIGYRLEPFVGKRDLADALAAGQPALAAGDWGASLRGASGRWGRCLPPNHRPDAARFWRAGAAAAAAVRGGGTRRRLVNR